MNQTVQIALDILRTLPPEQVADARKKLLLGENTDIGKIMLNTHSINRQNAEPAIGEALKLFDAEDAKREERQHILARSGQPPLKFRGTLLKTLDGETLAGRKQERWYVIAVYRTHGGKFVVQIGYRTTWNGEVNHDEAEVVETPAEVNALLRNCDATAMVTGFPVQYPEKQARLMLDMRRQFDAIVSAILATDEFAEEVE